MTIVVLDDEMVEFINSLVAAGRFAAPEAVIEAGLRLLEEREKERAAAISELRFAYQASLDRGGETAAEDVFSDVRARLHQLAKTAAE